MMYLLFSPASRPCCLPLRVVITDSVTISLLSTCRLCGSLSAVVNSCSYYWLRANLVTQHVSTLWFVVCCCHFVQLLLTPWQSYYSARVDPVVRGLLLSLHAVITDSLTVSLLSTCRLCGPWSAVVTSCSYYWLPDNLVTQHVSTLWSMVCCCHFVQLLLPPWQSCYSARVDSVVRGLLLSLRAVITASLTILLLSTCGLCGPWSAVVTSCSYYCLRDNLVTQHVWTLWSVVCCCHFVQLLLPPWQSCYSARVDSVVRGLLLSLHAVITDSVTISLLSTCRLCGPWSSVITALQLLQTSWQSRFLRRVDSILGCLLLSSFTHSWVGKVPSVYICKSGLGTRLLKC